jgi:hypothetical protein
MQPTTRMNTALVVLVAFTMYTFSIMRTPSSYTNFFSKYPLLQSSSQAK